MSASSRRRRIRGLGALALTGLVAATFLPSVPALATASTSDPAVCSAEEGTAVLPASCTPGDVVMTTVGGHELSVLVPAAGNWVQGQLDAEDGSTALRAASDANGTVTTEVTHFDAAAEMTTAAPSACSDTAYSFASPGNPKKWYAPLTWRFKTGSSPAGLSQASLIPFLQQSLVNNTTARNDCGMTDQISASGSYAGTTNADLDMSTTGCLATDGLDVVGFKDLGANNVLGGTCIWGVSHPGADEIVSIDVALDRLGHTWYLPGNPCSNDWNLEGVATHEFGHALGLGDLNESAHHNLTMSSANNGTCQGSELTLGRGDINGLQQLY